MRNLEPALVARRGLSAFFYQVVPSATGVLDSHAQTLEQLRQWGLPVEPHWRRCAGIDQLVAFCQEWQEKRRTLEFETDGVVIKVDDIDRRRRLGSTSKFPRWAIAFKFPAEQKTTLLRQIDVNVGRTGAVTPFAVLDPVFLAGSTISMATLHNADDIARKDIREGDYVVVEKAGDVIPRVVGPVLARRSADTQPWTMPVSCPRCGSALHKEEGEAVWRCENTSCPAKLQRGLEHFASRGAMNIEGLGESLIAQLIAQGLIEDCADLYALTSSQLATLTSSSLRSDGREIQRRFGEKNALKVVQEIDRSRSNELWRVIYGLGIRHIGERAAQVLARAFGSMDALCARDRRAASAYRTRSVPSSRSRSEPGSTSRAIERSWIGSGRPAFAWRSPPRNARRASAPGPLTGRTYVLTGTLASMTREQATAALERLGREGGRVREQEDDRGCARRRGRQQGRKGTSARRDHSGRIGLPGAHRQPCRRRRSRTRSAL